MKQPQKRETLRRHLKFSILPHPAMAVRVRLLSGAVVWEGERPAGGLAALRAAVAGALGVASEAVVSSALRGCPSAPRS